MNFDTRTVLDILLLDGDLEAVLVALVEAERIIWNGTSKNEFVKSVIPLVKDEIRFYMKHRAHRKSLGFLKKLINIDKVDYYRLIPAIVHTL